MVPAACSGVWDKDVPRRVIDRDVVVRKERAVVHVPDRLPVIAGQRVAMSEHLTCEE